MTAFTEQAYPSATPKPTTARPTYVLTLQATPGRDDIRSLRALLKTAGRPLRLARAFHSQAVTTASEFPRNRRRTSSVR